MHEWSSDRSVFLVSDPRGSPRRDVAPAPSTDWTARRLYTHDRANTLVPINAPDGSATPSFFAELLEQGIVSGPEAEADELAAFVLGRDAPGGWKLPGPRRASASTSAAR